MPFTTQYLAEWIAGISPGDIPKTAKAAAKRCLLDLMGAAVAGHVTPLAEITRNVAQTLFAPGPCSIWFSSARRQAPGAALANSAAASALDIDDGNRAGGGHPGAAVIPSALAVASETGADGEELLTAMIIGYEIGVRISAARDFAKQVTLSTGRWCAYAAAAAGGRLYGMPPEQLAQALAIAGIQSPDQAAAAYSAIEGNHVKEGIPWATMTGLTALMLAREGFSGPMDILDHPDFYDARKIRPFLNGQFAIEETYIKPYACCRWIHSALDAFFDLQQENHFSVSDIHAVQVETFDRARGLSNDPAPDSLEAAQYSLPFCLAVAALENRSALLPLSNAFLGRPDLEAFARKISIRTDPALDRCFPQKAAARVILKTGRGHFEKMRLSPLGDPDHPMDPDQLREKFNVLTRDHLSAEQQQKIFAAVRDIEQKGVAELLRWLSPVNA